MIIIDKIQDIVLKKILEKYFPSVENKINIFGSILFLQLLLAKFFPQLGSEWKIVYIIFGIVWLVMAIVTFRYNQFTIPYIIQFSRYRIQDTFNFGKPKKKELDTLISEFNKNHDFISNELLQCSPHSTNITLNEFMKSAKSKLRKKPIIFFKFKPRQYLPWMDAVYYEIAFEMKKIGFTPYIYLYDFSFQLEKKDSTSNIRIKELEDAEREDKLKITSDYIKKIVKGGQYIIKGSEFFSEDNRSYDLHNFLFKDVAERFINNDLADCTKQITSHEESVNYAGKKELFYRLLGYPTMLVANILKEKRPVLILQWEGRNKKMALVDQSGLHKACFLSTKTLYKDILKRETVDVEESYHLDDTEEILIDNLRKKYDEYGGRITLKYMCDLLLYRDNPLISDWQHFLHHNNIKDLKEILKGVVNNNFITRKLHGRIDSLLEIGEVSVLRKKIGQINGIEEAFLKNVTLEGIRKFQSKYGIKPNKK